MKPQWKERMRWGVRILLGLMFICIICMILLSMVGRKIRNRMIMEHPAGIRALPAQNGR
jgi:hypothetical protein